MDEDLARPYAASLDTVLRHDHLRSPGSIDELAVLGVQQLGASSAVMWLVDYEQSLLVPLLAPDDEPRDRLSVDGSVAGRAFRSVEPLEIEAEGGTVNVRRRGEKQQEELGVGEFVGTVLDLVRSRG